MCAKTVYEYVPEIERYILPPGNIDEALDFLRIFGNVHPVEIEIGSGKGRFILAESLRRPECNFLGIERAKKWLRLAAFRATRRLRDNCKLLCLDADFVVKVLVLPASVSAYHVYFPDPWPKDRHQKRRLFYDRFNQKLAETLLAGGSLYLKSDHVEYFESSVESILASGRFQIMNREVEEAAIEDFDKANETATHYEIKFRQEARPIHSAVFKNCMPAA